MLGALGGGCQVPIGAHATVDERPRCTCSAIVASPDGTEVIRAEAEGPVAEAADRSSLGRRTPGARSSPDPGGRTRAHDAHPGRAVYHAPSALSASPR